MGYIEEAKYHLDEATKAQIQDGNFALDLANLYTMKAIAVALIAIAERLPEKGEKGEKEEWII